MGYFSSQRKVGQYELEGYEQFSIVAGGSISAVSILLFFFLYYVRKAQFLRRHPGEILKSRSWAELLWALVFIVVPFIPSDEIQSEEKNRYRANSVTVMFAAIVQWSVLASELWFFVLGRDLFTSLTNPFTSYKASKKWYTFMVVGFSSFMALILIPIRKDNIGITSFFIPWLVQPCSLKKYTDEDVSERCVDAPIDWRKWLFLYIWVLLINLYTLGVLCYAYARLRKGVPHTLAQRNEVLQKSQTYIFSMCAFWIPPAFLATMDYYLNLGNSGAVQERRQDFNVAISVLLSLRGTWSVLTILYMYRRDYHRSATELIVRKAREEQSFQPHLNTALRTEVLFYATLCVRAAVMNHEVNDIQSSNSGPAGQGGGRETEMTNKLRPRAVSNLPAGVFEDNGQTYVYEVQSLGRQGLTSHPIARKILAAQETRTMMDRMSVRNTIRSEALSLDQLADELEGQEENALEAKLQAMEDTEGSVHNLLVTEAEQEATTSEEQPGASEAKEAPMNISSPHPSSMRTSGSMFFGDDHHQQPSLPGASLLDRLFPASNILRFRDYCPDLFTQIRRDICKIDPHDYMDSWTTTTNESFSEGASGAFIFFSKDGKYIVKTTTAGEMDVLISILPDYVKHLRENPHSRLLKILGAHRMECYGQKIEFLVMNNIFPVGEILDERYDLKGSWVNRSAGGGKERPRGKLLKDMDLNYVFMTREDVGFNLAEQIDKDVSFLCSKNLMDYSLLVGVQNATFPVEVEDELPSEMDPFIRDERGGMNAAVVVGPAVFYVGLIDILQVWNFQKQIERLAKIVFKCVDAPGLSAVPAAYYKDRFMERAVRENFGGAKSEKPPPTPLASERIPSRAEASTDEGLSGNSRSRSTNSIRRATFRHTDALSSAGGSPLASANSISSMKSVEEDEDHGDFPATSNEEC